MEQLVEEFWNKRFAEAGYAYGKEPNSFFKSFIDKMQPGRVLIPGAGEGRDAVYAAAKGWEVHCTDLSESGKKKALQLASEKGVHIEYDINSIDAAGFQDGYFDLVGSIFFHLPEATRKLFSEKVIIWLKPGGYFISELFTPEQIENTSGGPKDLSLLVTSAHFADDFRELEPLKNEETEVILNEGKYHQGKANVVRFIGRKK